jgi:two-component system response regulator RegA
MTGISDLSRGLLVDDDTTYLHALQRSLQKRGVAVSVALNGEQALKVARECLPDFALIDLRLATESGLELIAPMKQIRPDMRVLLLTGYASVATAVEAIKRGADNYLLKPISADAILRALDDNAAAAEPEVEAEATMTPLSRLEWEHIQQALNDTNGNISAAARRLGMHRRSLQRKLAKKPGPERRAPE